MIIETLLFVGLVLVIYSQYRMYIASLDESIRVNNHLSTIYQHLSTVHKALMAVDKDLRELRYWNRQTRVDFLNYYYKHIHAVKDETGKIKTYSHTWSPEQELTFLRLREQVYKEQEEKFKS